MDSVYEKALHEIGTEGNFQKCFDIVFNNLFVVSLIMSYMNIVLSIAIPSHHCELPLKPNNISEDQWKRFYIPETLNNSSTNKFSECLIYTEPGKGNHTQVCKKHVFDKTWYESTITSEKNWVCDNEINLANLIAYTKISETVGNIIFGWLGDVYGRRIPYILSLVFNLIGRCLSVFSFGSHTLFVIACLLAAFPSISAMSSAAVISMEISSARRRTIANTLRTIATSVGLIIMPLVFWWLRNWKTFMLVTSLTQIPFLILSWYMIESPRWLFLEGKSKKCVETLKIIAKRNGTELTPETEKEILNSGLEPKKQQLLGPLMLFSNKNVATNTIIQLYLWIALTISYIVLLLSAADSQGNPFLAFAWQSFAEIPGNFIGAWLADTIGRRQSVGISFAISSVIWLLTSFSSFWKSVFDNGWWIETTLALSNRFILQISYYVINLINMEIYPTCLRQSGIALGGFFSSIASILSPYFIILNHQKGPLVGNGILSVITLLAAVCSYILPETLNAKLPETLADTKFFGYFKYKDYKSLKLVRGFHDKKKSHRDETCSELPT